MALGVGETAIKRLCPGLGVPAWPYRGVGSFHKVIEKVGGVEGSTYDAIRELERRLGLLAGKPDSSLSSRTKTLRQFTYKLKRKEKKRAHRRWEEEGKYRRGSAGEDLRRGW